MPVKIITVPFDPDREIFEEEDLNEFLANKRIKQMSSQFFVMDGSPYWSVFVNYEPILNESIDEKAVKLDDKSKILFKKLRQWRKERADEEGVPSFIVASNRMLSALAAKKPTTMEALRAIPGIGEKKTEKYGMQLLAIVKGFAEKKTPDSPGPIFEISDNSKKPSKPDKTKKAAEKTETKPEASEKPSAETPSTDKPAGQETP